MSGRLARVGAGAQRTREKQQSLWQERAELEQSLVEYRGRLALVPGQMREFAVTRRDGPGGEAVPRRTEGTGTRTGHSVGERRKATEKARPDTEVMAPSTNGCRFTEAVTEASIALAAVEGERQALVMRREEQEAALARHRFPVSRKSAQLANSRSRSRRWRCACVRQGVFPKAQQLAALTRVQGPGEEELRSSNRGRGAAGELEAAQSRRLEAERGLLEAQAEVKLKTDEMNAAQGTWRAKASYRPRRETSCPCPAPVTAEVPDWLAAGLRPSANRRPVCRRYAAAPSRSRRPQGGDRHLRARIRSLGPVDEQAPTDYAERQQRYDFLTGQTDDLGQAEESLQEAIVELEEKIKERFTGASIRSTTNFSATSPPSSAAAPPAWSRRSRKKRRRAGRRNHGAAAGQARRQPVDAVRRRAVADGGIAALRASQTRPSPFCVLDEVDAMLDESNVGRFVEAVHKLAEATQFIIITHNRRTIETADHIYGVSMGKDSTSSVLSLRLTDLVPAMIQRLAAATRERRCAAPVPW